MALIKIKDFKETVPAVVIRELATEVGLVEHLMNRGYSLHVDSIMPETPKGYIEDSPETNIITIECYIDLKDSNEDIESIRQRMDASLVKPKFMFGFRNIDKIEYYDKNNKNKKWAVHTVGLEISKSPNEDMGEYCYRMLESLMKMLKVLE